MCEECPSYNNSIGCVSFTWECVKGKKCSSKYCLNIVPFSQQDSDITVLLPGLAPFIRSGENIFPLNIKKGGKLLPIAFTNPFNLTVVELGKVMAWGFVLGGAR